MPLRVLQRRFFSRPGGIRGEIARARHIRACRLLGTTDLPVAEIARTCGYANPSRFARLFRRAEGLSPTAYRRQEKAGRG